MFTYILIAFLVILGVSLSYLWLIHPETGRRAAMAPYLTWFFAHRGLHDMQRPLPIPENSLAAFEAAIDNGYAIELDVHRTLDGELLVFHDDTLTRMCGLPGRIEAMRTEELASLTLGNSDCPIPRLSEVLDLVGGRVPLLIELKMPTRDYSICALAHRLLSDYRGMYLIQSFNPFALLWFRRNAPEVLRGQLTSRYARSRGLDGLCKWASSTLLVNTLSRPDFISCNFKKDRGLGLRLNQRLFGAVTFAWTVRSRHEFDQFSPRYHSLIFERFRPDQAGLKSR